MSNPKPGKNPEPEGLNPDLKKGHDDQYAEDQHGSAPLDTVSVTEQGPAVWPIIWAVATVVLVLIALFLVFA